MFRRARRIRRDSGSMAGARAAPAPLLWRSGGIRRHTHRELFRAAPANRSIEAMNTPQSRGSSLRMFLVSRALLGVGLPVVLSGAIAWFFLSYQLEIIGRASSEAAMRSPTISRERI